MSNIETKVCKFWIVFALAEISQLPFLWQPKNYCIMPYWIREDCTVKQFSVLLDSIITRLIAVDQLSHRGVHTIRSNFIFQNSYSRFLTKFFFLLDFLLNITLNAFYFMTDFIFQIITTEEASFKIKRLKMREIIISLK